MAGLLLAAGRLQLCLEEHKRAVPALNLKLCCARMLSKHMPQDATCEWYMQHSQLQVGVDSMMVMLCNDYLVL